MSGNKANRQAMYTVQPTLDPNRAIDEVAMFGANGQPISIPPYISVSTNDLITTVAKTTTTAEPSANTLVFVKYIQGNSVVSTLTFSGGVARTIYLGGAAPTAAKHTVAANGIVGFWFDGTILHMLGSM
jgi:hypothetical protein